MGNKSKRRVANELRFFWGMILIILCLTFAITAFTALADVPADDTADTIDVRVIPAETLPAPIETEYYVETDSLDTMETMSELPELVIETETAATIEAYGVSMSDSDYDLLCKIVEAEATGQEVEGKMYVAAAIMNRVNSDSFPDTVSGVVYEKGQFSPVRDGRINCTPTETTIEAVNRVLSGETDAQGATFFMNPEISSKKNVDWFRSHLTYLFSYGGHEFYK